MKEKKYIHAKHRKFISCSYVNDMKCWNNLEKEKIQPKGNDDMMQCVTCNKSFLFAPRLKTRKQQISLWSKKKLLNVVKVKDANSFLYKM